MSTVKTAGLLLGFLGVFVVSEDGLTGKVSTLGVVLANLTAIIWAIGVIYVKKVNHKVDSMWLVALQCFIRGAILTVVGSGVEDLTSIVWNATYLFGLTYGSILGVTLAFIIYFR
ncbi:EamA family transporter [Neobacillus cucumis]|uniref:EamA family transporter n=1 Tax=Neobacillus cucumis TaxID=1740721 RepID=UPI002853235F|nr:EamA family transporter [Neobacillus cucumis]MDR4950366.1 EamA family transporter [Neobacillus cucumis]